MIVVRTSEEIEDLYDEALNAIENGTVSLALNYEDGIVAAIDWLLGRIDDNPMED